MSLIDIIILTIIIVLFLFSLRYLLKRGGCNDCPSHGTCNASKNGCCPVSSVTIDKIESSLNEKAIDDETNSSTSDETNDNGTHDGTTNGESIDIEHDE